MKRLILTNCIACLLLFGCSDGDKEKSTTTTGTAPDTTATATKDGTDANNNIATAPPMDSAAMMQAWMEYMTPTDVHKMMAKSNGTWTEDLTIWMAPDAPPSKSKATAVNRMVLGGRYQEGKHTGSFDGMPFEGIGMLAYDNAKKVFQTSWVDNMSTGMMFLEGPWDSTTNTINFTGKMVDPQTKQNMNIRQVFTMTDDNNQKVEMYCDRGGKEYKSMEIVLKRK